MSSEGKKMPLSKLAKLTGIPKRTLGHAAQRGTLKADLKFTEFGTPYYEATIEAVEAWKNDPTVHVPKYKKNP